VRVCAHGVQKGTSFGPAAADLAPRIGGVVETNKRGFCVWKGIDLGMKERDTWFVRLAKL
jgi:hypothetical protein